MAATAGMTAASLADSAAPPETLRVLSAMVEFVPDDDDRTSGNGTFNMTEPLSIMKDPPPHDSTYFHNHLTFLKNYFRKVSDGNLVLETTLLADVYRLSGQMRNYSPTRSTTNNEEIAHLAVESWTIIDSVSPGLDFAAYDAFILFHAGVGRDIDLVSIYGFDPTPFDIPSLYLNLNAFRNVYGAAYNGIPVSGGTFAIPNTIIIPETETRTVSTGGGSVVLELGINGILAANIGSHLGLPDLFDTRTGRSGIGRFGLMDGQSIFSWGGFIPPEPSAWEKIFLGWAEPVTVPAGSHMLDLPAVGLAGSPATIYRVDISSGEYFLVENRNRDAMRDGSTVSAVWSGDTLMRTWARDTTGYTFVDQDSLYGTLLDVDEFDWSLPGGVNTRTGEWFDGGVLVWHIDESVIDANLQAGTVNVDPEHRGVDLEEADGSQDIGQSYGFISAGSGSEDGTVLDFWYDGNRAPLRIDRNVFDPVSNPNSLGYRFTNSHSSVSEFSPSGPVMTARFTVGDSLVSPVAGFPKITGSSFSTGSVTSGDDGLLVSVSAGPGPRVYGWNRDGVIIFPGPDSSGLIPFPPSLYGLDSLVPRSALGYLDDDFYSDIVLAGNSAATGRVLAFELNDSDADTYPDSIFNVSVGQRLTTAPVISDSFVAVGAEKGFVYLVARDGSSVSEFNLFPEDSSDVVSLALLGVDGGYLAGSSSGRFGTLLSPVCLAPGLETDAGASNSGGLHVASGRFASGSGTAYAFTFVTVSTDGSVVLADACGGVLPGFPVQTGGPISNAPAIADFDGDGMKDVIFFSGRNVYVLNQAGFPLDGFPVMVETETDLSGSPVVADLDGDRSMEVTGVTDEGLVFAYKVNGMMLSGFPLQAGPARGVSPAVYYMSSPCLSCADIGLAVGTADGYVYAWKTGIISIGPSQPPVQPWPQFAHDSRNTSSEDSVLSATPPQSEFFPASLAYNWPNPVGKEDGFLTHIRYFVSSDASVTIRIFDLAGNLVKTFEGLSALGGLDNEVGWDVSGVESGIYFAQVEAIGSGGSGHAVIRIAVVK